MTSGDGRDGAGADRDSGTYLRTEFLERIAHELRGPAGVTLGALDEMEFALGADAEKIKSLLAMARRGTRRVLRTAERLNRTAQLVGREVEWSRAPMDVKNVLQQAVRDAELIEARKGITVVLAVPSEPCTVTIDGAWVSAAITELVVNAIAHARKVVSVAVTGEEWGAMISVTDDGAGFAGPVLDRFTPPRERRGLGLSLAIVQDVASAHGGELVVDVKKPDDAGITSHGATVRLKIPHTTAAAE